MTESRDGSAARGDERQGAALGGEEPGGTEDAELRAMFAESGSAPFEGGPDAELQRALVAASLFGGPPVSIGRFAVEKVLGAGASAVVYATRDPLLDRRVALKVMARPDPERSQAVLSRVIREARAAAQLSHGNLVSIYEVGEWDGRPFIAMELIEGSTLGQWLIDERRTPAQICEVFLQAARGLAAAHAQGRVHRDFKPANVLVARSGRVVVSDFGLAGDISAARPQLAHGTGEMTSLLSEDATTYGPLLGTPAYAAPEQRGGAPAHPSADVYSFAISLIEALLGYHPSAHPGGRGPRGGKPSAEARGEASDEKSGAAPAELAARGSWRQALRARVPRQLFAELCAAAEPDRVRRAQSLGPLLKALRAFDPARKRQRRGFYLVGISALFSGVALAAVIGVGLARCEVRTPSFRGAAAPMRGQRAVAAEVAALASAAPSQRDREWRRRANEVLLQPIATEISCAWNSPPQDITLVGESALGLDERGDLFACDLRDGSVAPEPVATGAWCVRPDDDGSIEVALERGGVETYVQVRRRWQRSGLTVVRTAQYGTDESLCASSLTRVSEGTRTLSLEGPSVSSLGLYYSAAPGAAPRLVGDGVVEFRTWPGLRYALVISSSVKVLDLEVGQEVVAPDPEVRNKALRLISLGGDFAVVHVFEGQLLWWRRGDDRWHRFSIAQPGIKALSVSPKGRVAVIGHAGRLQVVDLESGWRYPLAEGQMRQARFLDEDHVVATDVSGHIWRWSLSSLRSKVLAEHGGRGAMWGLALSPDATMVASSSGGKDGSCVQLTSLVEGAARASSSWKMPAGTGVHALTFQDELLIAGSSDSVLHRWRWRSGEALPKIQLPKAEWIWTATPGRRRDGSSFLLIGTGRLLGERGADDLRSDKELRMGCRVLSLEGESLRSWLDQPGGGNTGIDSLDVSPDGRLGAAATSAPSLAVIDLQTGQTLVTPATSRGELRAAAFFDDGRRLFTIGDDGVVSIWSVAVGDDGLRLERRSVRSVRHGALYKLKLAAGSAFVGAEDGHISRRSLATGESEASYPGHSISITALDVDPRGTWIASGDVSGRLLLSRVDGRAPPLALSGHMADAQITNVRFLRDGRLITSSNDRTVRLWSPAYQLSDAELLAELRRFVPVRSR